MWKYSLIALMILKTTHLVGQVKNPLDDGRKIIIPIVFHVLYEDSNQNINENLIMQELQDLNLDFSASNSMVLLDNDFSNLVGNANIEFVLLDTLVNGNEIHGIQRVDSKKLKKRETLLINPTYCLNVFIADQGNASDILSDRINLNYEDVGQNSHVLTHETGHWLGLYHTFGQIGNSSAWNVAFGNHNDLIDDTPLQRKATAVCYSITKSCPCPPTNIWYKGHKIIYNNFMDYNPCRCMFTIKQTIQMRNNIIENKKELFPTS